MKFPEHKCGLFLTHNEHRDYYQKLEEYMEERSDLLKEMTEEDRAECIRTDSLWTLQWYPDTPVGFCHVAGPTLERVLELANVEGTAKGASE